MFEVRVREVAAVIVDYKVDPNYWDIIEDDPND